MPTRALVNVIIIPGIFGHAVGLEIGAAPVLCVAWRDDQILQAVLALGVVAVIHFKSVKSGFEGGDLSLRGGDLRLLGAVRESGQHDGGKDSQDDQHQQQFHEREPVLWTAMIFSFG